MIENITNVETQSAEACPKLCRSFLRNLIRMPLDPLIRHFLKDGSPEGQNILDLCNAQHSEIKYSEHLSSEKYDAFVIRTADGRITATCCDAVLQAVYLSFSMYDTPMHRSYICDELHIIGLPNNKSSVAPNFLAWPFPEDVDKLEKGEGLIRNFKVYYGADIDPEADESANGKILVYMWPGVCNEGCNFVTEF